MGPSCDEGDVRRHGLRQEEGGRGGLERWHRRLLFFSHVKTIAGIVAFIQECTSVLCRNHDNEGLPSKRQSLLSSSFCAKTDHVHSNNLITYWSVLPWRWAFGTPACDNWSIWTLRWRGGKSVKWATAVSQSRGDEDRQWEDKRECSAVWCLWTVISSSLSLCLSVPNTFIFFIHVSAVWMPHTDVLTADFYKFIPRYSCSSSCCHSL